MKEKSSPEIRLADLLPEHRIAVLEWMGDAITDGIKKIIAQKSYWHYVQAITEKKRFDPETVWQSIEPHQRRHFVNCQVALDILSDQISIAEDEIDDSSDDELDTEPEETEPQEKPE